MAESAISPSVAAGILLLARECLADDTAWPQTVAEVLRLTGAGKSQAYEMRDRLRGMVPSLTRSPGRPPTPEVVHSHDDVCVAVRDYLARHPGACSHPSGRRTYSDDFRRFVLSLAEKSPANHMSIAQLADATGVPLGTLKDWLHPVCGKPEQTPQTHSIPFDTDLIRDTHLRLIVTLWEDWQGTFRAFCTCLRREHRLPYSDTFVGDYLAGLGLRHRERKRPVEAPWSSNTFRTLFPAAQWIGDGTTVAIWWNGERFIFNVEAMVDAATNAIVGLAVTDAEDERAVCQVYETAKRDTGSPPLAVTLDNRPSNHSPRTLEALADTTVLRATPGRGQAKAPVEGTFGLMQQMLPPLVVEGESPRERAHRALQLVLDAWALGRNGKPRRKLGGRTPVDAYIRDVPTLHDIERAQQWFKELRRRQERARLTRDARRDPARRQTLSEALAALGIADPEHRIAVALSGYSRDAIVRGVAIFRAKVELGTLPPDVEPARYLGGIIRNLHIRLELEHMATHLLEQRIRMGDVTLAPLLQERTRLRGTLSESELLYAFVARSLRARYSVDFSFWADAAASALASTPGSQMCTEYRRACRHISASHQVQRIRREDLIDRLAQIAAKH